MRSRVRPLRQDPVMWATGVAGTYLVFTLLWIIGSSLLASAVADSILDLRTLEILKGFVFASVTTLALYLGTWTVFGRFQDDAMALLRTREAFVEAERQANAGLLARAVGHDINNVLTALQLSLDDSRWADASRVDQAMFRSLQEGTRQLAQLVNRLRDAAGKRDHQRVRSDLPCVVRAVLPLIRMHGAVRHCDLKLDLHPVTVDADPELIKQILWNLVLNAADAAGRGGRVLVRTGYRDGGAVLEVHDDGPGILPEARQRLFEPLFTTKEHGTGLGLVSVRWCAEAQGGEVEVAESDLGGACFRVTLPRRVAVAA